MSTAASKFYGLHGVTVNRNAVQALATEAEQTSYQEVATRLQRVLNTYPTAKTFVLDTSAPLQQKVKPETLAGEPFFTQTQIRELCDDGPDDALGKVSANDVYQMITDSILKVLQEGKEIPWRKQWAGVEKYGFAARNFVTKKPYKGINAVMLNFIYPVFLKRVFEIPYFLTFKQVEAAGGRIKKGSEAVEIFYYTTVYKFESADEKIKVTSLDKKEFVEKLKEANPAILKSISAEDISEQSFIPLIKYYNAFSADDIEGIDWKLPKPEDVKRPKNGFQKNLIAEAILKHFKNKPEIVHKDASGAYYMPAKDFVNMPPQETWEDEEAYYSVLMHELGHSTGHKSRLNRDMKGRFGDESYAFEELIAELCSAFTNAETGYTFNTKYMAASYLKGWASKLGDIMEKNNKFFPRAVAKAQAAADHILKRDAEGNPAYYKDLEAILKTEVEKEPEAKSQEPKSKAKWHKPFSETFPQYTDATTEERKLLFAAEKKFKTIAADGNFSFLRMKGKIFKRNNANGQITIEGEAPAVPLLPKTAKKAAPKAMPQKAIASVAFTGGWDGRMKKIISDYFGGSTISLHYNETEKAYDVHNAKGLITSVTVKQKGTRMVFLQTLAPKPEPKAEKEVWQIPLVTLQSSKSEAIMPLEITVSTITGQPIYKHETTVLYDGKPKTWKYERKFQHKATQAIEKLHELILSTALIDGKKVPDDVLADYPKLKAAIGNKNAPPKPTAKTVLVTKFADAAKARKTTQEPTGFKVKPLSASMAQAVKDVLGTGNYKGLTPILASIIIRHFKHNPTAETVSETNSEYERGILKNAKTQEYCLFSEWSDELELTPAGEKFVKAVLARYQSFINQKHNYSLFPTLAGVDGNVSKQYHEAYKQNVKFMYDWCRNKLIGKTVIHPEIKEPIQFNAVGFKKAIKNKSDSRLFLNSFLALVFMRNIPKIIETSKLVSVLADNKSRNNISTVYKLENSICIEKSVFVTVEIVLRETKQGLYFYNLSVQNESSSLRKPNEPHLSGAMRGRHLNELDGANLKKIIAHILKEQKASTNPRKATLKGPTNIPALTKYVEMCKKYGKHEKGNEQTNAAGIKYRYDYWRVPKSKIQPFMLEVFKRTHAEAKNKPDRKHFIFDFEDHTMQGSYSQSALYKSKPEEFTLQVLYKNLPQKPTTKKATLKGPVQDVVAAVQTVKTVATDVAQAYADVAALPSHLISLVRPIQAQPQQAASAFNLQGEVGKFLGQIERKTTGSVAMALSAPAGAGKSRLTYQVANEFATSGHTVLLASIEMGANSRLVADLTHQYIAPENADRIHIAGEFSSYAQLKELAKHYDVVIVDSWNKVPGLPRLDDLRQSLNGKFILAIFQQTTDGSMRGGADSQFDADMVANVAKFDDYNINYAYWEKNRYNPNASTSAYAIASQREFSREKLM